MVLDELVALLGFKVAPGSEQARRHYEGGMASLERKAQAVALALTRVGIVAGGALATGMAALGKSVVSTSAQFEGFEAQLTTIEGSSEKARKSLDWISKFGKTTPYEVAGITDAFVRLKSQGIDPIADDALRTLGDASSAMNKPLMQAVEAFTDAATFQFERLKEFGIVSSQKGDEVTFQYTKNGKQLQEVVKKDGEAIRRFLLENFGERFSGAMDRQSRTYSGMLSNLSDSWTDFQLRIGQAGFFDAIKGRLTDLLNGIARLDADGTLDRWAGNISAAFERALSVMDFGVERVRTYVTALGNIGKRAPGDLATWLRNIAAAAFLMSSRFRRFTAFGLLIGFLDDLATYFAGGDSFTGDFIDWLNDTGVYGEGAAAAVDALVAALEGLFALLGDGSMAERLDSYLGGIQRLAGAFMPGEGGMDFGRRLRERVLGTGFQSPEMRARQEGIVRDSRLARFAGVRSRPLSDADQRKIVNGVAGLSNASPENHAYQMANNPAYTARNGGGPLRLTVTPSELAQQGAQSIANDNRVTHINVHQQVNQTVQQAAEAPSAAAAATASAMGEAARVHAEGVQ